MSKPDDFLSRWSRLKRRSEEKRKAGCVKNSPAVDEAEGEAGSLAPQDFDLTLLPSIDFITAGTDIRSFLQLSVPADLARAALRRAWVSEPAIRDFIGIAENQWDFNNAAAIPGFGPLRDMEDPLRLVAQLVGMPDKLATGLSDAHVSVEKPVSVRCEPAHDKIGGRAGPRPAALKPASGNPASVPLGRERSEAVVVKRASSSEGLGWGRHRRSHGGALPR